MKRFFSLCLAAAFLVAPAAVMAQSAQEILNQFKNEPTIEATMDAAVHYAGLQADRYESMFMRAGGSNALPKILSYELTYRDQDRDRPQIVTTWPTGTPSDTNFTSKKVTAYEEDTTYMQHKFKAQWDLSRVVFNSEQVRAASMASSAANSRDRLLDKVTKAYFGRRTLQTQLITNPPTDVAEQLKLNLKIEEFTATLNALTGGWFSKNIR